MKDRFTNKELLDFFPLKTGERVTKRGGYLLRNLLRVEQMGIALCRAVVLFTPAVSVCGRSGERLLTGQFLPRYCTMQS